MARRPRFDVQHFIGCLETQVIPPAGVFNLYTLGGVGPVYRLADADAFPTYLWRFDLFARFFVHTYGPAHFEIELENLDGGSSGLEVYGPYTVHFRAGEQVRDYTFGLRTVPFDAAGRHAFRLFELRTPRRILRVTEYLIVED